ncbi:hypothetical protein Tco_1383597, partial [Tanacetum coccineum]
MVLDLIGVTWQRKKLEARVKIGKARKRVKVVLSKDDEDVEDDSSKQGRKLSDAEVQEKESTKTEPFIQEVTPTVARDEEIPRQWDEEERQRAMSEAKSTKKIDCNDPSVIRYHALKMKLKTVAQARRNMVKFLKN